MEKIEKLKIEIESAIDKEKAKLLNDLAFAYLRRDKELTKVYVKESMKISEEMKDEPQLARSYNIIGIVFHNVSDYKNALKNYTKAYEIFKKHNLSQQIAGSLNNIGASYEKLAVFDEALEKYLEAVKIWEKIDHKKNISVAYNNIGIIFEKQKNFKKALEYHFKSLELKKMFDDQYAIAVSYNNIGINYFNLDKYKLTIEYYLKALEIKKELGDKKSIAITLVNIGHVYLKEKYYQKSLSAFNEGLQLFGDIKDRYGVASSYLNLGILNTEMKNYIEAEKFLGYAISIGKEIDAKSLEIGSILKLAILLEAQGLYKRALEAYTNYSNRNSELFNEEKARQISEIRLKYETDQKEKEIELSHLKNIELVEMNEKLQKEIEIRKKAEAEIIIGRERLMLFNKVLRHDLANNLVAMKSGVNLFKMKQEQIYIDEIENKIIKSIKTIKRLSKHEHFIDSHDYLQVYEINDVLDYLTKLYPQIKFEIKGKSKVYADDAIYSVFENLISNAQKHGRADMINISITSAKLQTEIRFADNGIGINADHSEKIFDEGFYSGKSGNTGIGLYIVRENIVRFGGDIFLDINYNQGACFVIKLQSEIKTK